MRLWTFHPKYLDARGLGALWREALLAQAVLRGRTEGYARHPQLLRFRRSRTPLRHIAEYLRAVHAEGKRRGYSFDAGKIGRGGRIEPLCATRGQLRYEWSRLSEKLRCRDPGRFAALRKVRRVEPHPSFRIVAGGVEDWERTGNSAAARRLAKGA